MGLSATAAAETEPTPYGLGEEPRAFAAFRRSHTDFGAPGLDRLRATEYARLDAQGQVYLDYTGGGLYAESQLTDHVELLRNTVLGNPHSTNPTSVSQYDVACYQTS
jgi:hypothetical protein